MSVSRPSPITGLCGRSAVQSYKEKNQRHKFFIAYLSDFNTWRLIFDWVQCINSLLGDKAQLHGPWQLSMAQGARQGS